MVEGKEPSGKQITKSTVGDDSVFGFDFGAEAVGELVKGMVRDTGAIFDIRIDNCTDLVFGDYLALVFHEQIEKPGFGGRKTGRGMVVKVFLDQLAMGKKGVISGNG